jgi:membrane-associated protease RseP (regulator of RpoE activity)
MKHFLRPYRNLGLVVLAVAVAMTPAGAHAQMREVGQLLEQPNPLLLRAGSQGYLGVDLADVDQEKAQALKLKEVRGAIVTLVDHDAPAGQIGLKVNDVVLQLNGQPVEGSEQLRRMLREIPAGRKVSIEISRDGAVQTLTVALADRRIMEQDVWNRIGESGDVFTFSPGMGMMAGGGGDAPPPGSFHMPFFGSSLKVGALVEPLTSQMAEYLGVQNGLMVKQVAGKSEAAAAGMRAFDVILRVGADSIATLADWDRALRANQGKPVQVTVLRDRKQQTLLLQVDSKRHSELEMEDLFPAGDGAELAWMGPEFNQGFVFDESDALELRDQAEALRSQLKGVEQFRLSPEQAQQIRKQAEELSKNFKAEDFKLDAKEMDELKQQLEEFRKNFKAEDFKIDPKMMDQLKQQMEQLKRQMEEMKAPGVGGKV